MTVRNIVCAAAGYEGSPAPDPKFNQVTLLLNGDGTNGQQNNTLLDSSSNNFTITRNGTPTQGSVTPYWPNGQWSNYFSGTAGNYISVPDNAAFQLGSGDFTIEGWVNLSSLTASSYLMGKGDRATVAGSAFSLPFTGYTMDFYAGSSVFSLSTFTPTLNVWFHIALVRNGTTITRYINGVSNASVTIGTASINTGGSNEVRIGGYVNSTGFLGINGYLSNLRIVKGTALYTSNFTPSTTPLTAVSGTSLLTCQSNRLKDNSSNNFAITRTGTPAVQQFNPFSSATSYNPTTNGGSMYLDGSSYLSLASNSAFDQSTPTEVTVEMWIYPTSASPTNQYLYYQNTANFLNLLIYSSSKVAIFNGTYISFPNETVTPYAWTHAAFKINSSGYVSFWLNGVSIGGFSATFPTSANPLLIGSNGTNGFIGHIAGLRVTRGSGITPGPTTTPPTAVSGTGLLLNFTNAGIVDSAMLNDLVTVGNAQVSTAVKKYGTGSMYFDGSGDWLTYSPSQNTVFRTGSFTIEGWFYINNASSSTYFLIDNRNSSQTNNWGLYRDIFNQLNWVYSSSSSYNFGTFDTTGSWVHIAVTRDGTNLRAFVNGTQLGSTITDSTDYSVASTISYIGSNYQGTSPLNGYIDDLRITKGFARYIANFTPPTKALPTN